MRKRIQRAVELIQAMTLDELRAEWKRRLHKPPPRCRSKDVMRGLLAWAIQAQAYGGLAAETKTLLKQLGHRLERTGRTADLPRSNLMPGAVLTRTWQGQLHKVHVLDRGYSYEGRRYDSLSVVARLITRTRWSGPRFFGLDRRPGQAGQERQ